MIHRFARKSISLQKAEDKASLLIAASKNSHAAINMTDVRCEHLKQHAKRIIDLKQQKKEIIIYIVNISKERIYFEVLISFPVIEEPTAVRIISELGYICRFKNSKQINAYVVIDIHRYQSGKLQHQDRINKRGNKRLRK